MSATVRASPVKRRQATRLIVVALLPLSMTSGIAGTATHVCAA